MVLSAALPYFKRSLELHAEGRTTTFSESLSPPTHDWLKCVFCPVAFALFAAPPGELHAR